MVRPAEGPRHQGPISNVEETEHPERCEQSSGETGVESSTPTRTADAGTAAAAQQKAMACPTAQHLRAQLDSQLDTESAQTPVESFQTGHAATVTALATGTEMAEHGAQAIAAATQLAGTGRITTHGTITNSGGRLSYSPAPRDHLVVPAPDGDGTVSYQFHDVQGNFRSVDAFFANDHSMDFSSEIEGEMDMRFSSTKRGNNRTATARGTLAVDGVEYTTDLTYDTRENFRHDGPGSESTRNIAVSGTVTSEQGRLTVDESAEVQGATAEVRDGLGGRATSTTRTINNLLEIGEDAYRWNGVSTRTSFRDGRPSNVDTYWRAEGSITKNGDPYGSYRLRQTRDDVRILLQAPGQTVALEAYDLR